MITKATFIDMITTIMKVVDHTNCFNKRNNRLTDSQKAELLEGYDYQKDLITMLTAITIDRYGVIRDYLFKRNSKNEFYFDIPNGNTFDTYRITYLADLYEYLAEQSKDLVLTASKII